MELIDLPLLLLKILPFIAVIVFELSPVTLASRFESVVCEYFDSTKYELLSEEALDVLHTNLSYKHNNISNAEINSLFSTLQQEVGINEKVARENLADYVRYTNDWISTKVSLFVTTLSVLAVLTTRMSTSINSYKELIIWIEFFLLISILIIIFGNCFIDIRFKRIGPHEYSRDAENGLLLIPKYRVILNILVILFIILLNV